MHIELTHSISTLPYVSFWKIFFRWLNDIRFVIGVKNSENDLCTIIPNTPLFINCSSPFSFGVLKIRMSLILAVLFSDINSSFYEYSTTLTVESDLIIYNVSILLKLYLYSNDHHITKMCLLITTVCINGHRISKYTLFHEGSNGVICEWPPRVTRSTSQKCAKCA